MEAIHNKNAAAPTQPIPIPTAALAAPLMVWLALGTAPVEEELIVDDMISDEEATVEEATAEEATSEEEEALEDEEATSEDDDAPEDEEATSEEEVSLEEVAALEDETLDVEGTALELPVVDVELSLSDPVGTVLMAAVSAGANLLEYQGNSLTKVLTWSKSISE